MNPDLVFIKTAAGEEAMRLQTKVMQRNVRTVLILVDGSATFSELCLKMLNPKLTENALIDLERGGFITRRNQSVVDKISEINSQTESESLQLEIDHPAGFVLSRFSLEPPEIMHPPIIPEPVQSNEKNQAGEDFSRQSVDQSSSLGSRFSSWREARRVRINHSRRHRPYRPMNSSRWKRLLLLCMVIFLSLLGLLVISFPYSVYLPEIEAAFARSIGRDAKIGNVQVSFYPRPGIQLDNVIIATEKNLAIDSGDIRIAQILLEPRVDSLFSPVKVFRNVFVRGVSLPIEKFSFLPALFSEASKPDSPVRIDRLQLARANLLLAGISFSDMDGEVNLPKNGLMTSVLLRTADRALTATILPSDQRTEITLEGYGLRLPASVPVVLDSATIKGVLEHSVLSLKTIELRVFDGLIQGNAVLQSAQKSSISGNLVAERLNSTRLCSALGLASLLSGDLGGKIRFSAAADSWPEIFGSIHAEGDFSMQRGSLRGIDLAEAVRRVSDTPVQGGVTNFEQLSGRMRLSPTGSRFYNLQMNSGLMQSSGTIDLGSNQVVSGRMTLQMRGSVNQTRVPITLGGTLQVPAAFVDQK